MSLKQTELIKSSTSRRNFLKICSGTIFVLSGLGTAGSLIPRKPLLRPPGGQNENLFLARCIRCDRCKSICPTKAIGLANVTDSLLAARTPVMKFHIGYCDFCNQCVNVCPTGALQEFTMESIKIGQATVNPKTCIAFAARGCNICVEACPYKAIQLNSYGHPVVDNSKCNGCGKCEKLCPSLILRSYEGGHTRGIIVEPLTRGVT